MIAIHTFLTVIWGGSHFWRKLLPAYLVIGCISLFLVIFIGITVGTQTHGTQHYMAPAGVSRSQILAVVEFMWLQQFWCWIRPGSRYNAQRLVGEYVWIWSVVGISVITYIPSALVARGSISVSEDCWWKFTFRRKQDRPPDPLLINKQLMMVAYVVYQLKSKSVKLISPLHQLPCHICHTCFAYQHCPLDKWLWKY